MKHFYFMLAMLFLGIQHQAYAEDDKVKIPDEQNWGKVENCKTNWMLVHCKMENILWY